MKVRSVGAACDIRALKGGDFFIGGDTGQTILGIKLFEEINARGVQCQAISISGNEPEPIAVNFSVFAITKAAIEPALRLEAVNTGDRNPSPGELVMTPTQSLIAVSVPDRSGVVYCDVENGHIVNSFVAGEFARFKKWRVIAKVDDDDDEYTVLWPEAPPQR